MKRILLILVLVLSLVGISGCIDSSTDTSGDPARAYIVVSNSMEPTLYEGDVAIVDNTPDNIQVGDIVIYNAVWFSRPIIHRVIDIKQDSYGNTFYEMKGDNNPVPDPELVSRGQITSKVEYTIPKVGYIILWIRET